MFDKLRMFILNFIKSNKEYPLIALIASGLYPILYYYASNYGHANSFKHLAFFVFLFIALPYISLILLRLVFNKVSFLKPYRNRLIAILNVFCFSVFILIATSGLNTLKVLSCVAGAILFGIVLHKHIKKLVVFQYFMAFVALFWVAPNVYESLTSSTKWMQQPDAIENVKLIKTPNIYIIQPDGYANFSELKKGHYAFNNSEFEGFLAANQFTLYDDFRSNYFSTLSSNASMFAMKHHYYNNAKYSNVEPLFTRGVIAGDNLVVDIFKRNGYATHLILESEYLISNKPKLKYNDSNIAIDEVSYLSKGFEIKRDVISDLEKAIENQTNSSHFYFIEKILPGHIAQSRFNNLGKEKERTAYLDNLEKANQWLKKIIKTITNKDKNCLIVIVADHGGFVGMNSIYEAKIKQDDPDLVKSVFASALAIKWPEDDMYSGEIKTSVNLFRTLFSYLSNDTSYLNHLEEDASYLAIRKKAPFGVYKAIDENGKVVFEKK
ncbi:sulfatase-like hydrolase/transferase [Lacinutrix iliipiscaria]|uniref:Sulfatase-like hydrolase/transferase n=1 Tax=Lacinutrix iliipiscaria TaxID=1230532 RepID=A0ABW5WN66_9FLAO